MRDLLLLLGLPGTMPTIQVIVLAAVVGIAAVLLGWVADMIMGEDGFGIGGNAVILAIGAVLGAMLWQSAGIAVTMNANAARALAAGAAGVIVLIAFGLMRRIG